MEHIYCLLGGRIVSVLKSKPFDNSTRLDFS